MGWSAPAAAEAPIEPTEEEPPPPTTCSETCSAWCDCKRESKLTDYNNVIFFNFGATFAGRLELEYERALHTRVSIFGTLYVVAFDSIGNERLIGFGGLVGARVFLLGDAPEGIWFAWSIGGFRRQSRPNLTEVDVKLGGMQTGGMIGWTGIWSRFALTLGGGATYSYSRLKVFEQSMKAGEWDPWFKIGVGVAF